MTACFDLGGEEVALEVAVIAIDLSAVLRNSWEQPGGLDSPRLGPGLNDIQPPYMEARMESNGRVSRSAWEIGIM